MVRAVTYLLATLLIVICVGCSGEEAPPPEESNPTSSIMPEALRKKPPAPPKPKPAPTQTAAAPATGTADTAAAGTGDTAADATATQAPPAQVAQRRSDPTDESSGFGGMSGGADGGMSEFDRALMGLDSQDDANDESTGFEGLGGGPTNGIPEALRGGPGGLGAGGPGVEAIEPGFKRSAMTAFLSGRNRDGLQYNMAHALTNEEGAEELLPSIQWVKALQRPALGVRWAIGVQLIAPRKFSDDPKPIGSTQEFEGSDDGGGGFGSGGGDFGSGGDDFGSGGDFSSGGDFGSAPGGFGGSGSDAGNENVSEYAGEFGDFLLEELQARVDEGYFGEVFQNAPKGGARRDSGDSGGRARGSRLRGRSEPSVDFVSPAITYVGLSKAKNAEKELLNKAAGDGVDALLIFRVTIKKNPRRDFITNDTVASVYHVSKGNRLVWTRALQNVKVQRAREREEDDGLDAEIEKITSFVDANLSMTPLPDQLNNDNVQRRVASLASSQPEDMLPVLTEISFWHHQGFLSEEDKAQAFVTLLGNPAGQLLATGTEDEKKEAIDSWLPGNRSSLSRSRTLPQ